MANPPPQKVYLVIPKKWKFSLNCHTAVARYRTHESPKTQKLTKNRRKIQNSHGGPKRTMNILRIFPQTVRTCPRSNTQTRRKQIIPPHVEPKKTMNIGQFCGNFPRRWRIKPWDTSAVRVTVSRVLALYRSLNNHTGTQQVPYATVIVAAACCATCYL